ncbi:HNH endonuclease [Trinickia terrae]|nr:HNH endonuclease [Trinickia terrae]
MSARRSVWRMSDHAGEDADKAFQRLRRVVLDACAGRCEFCGFASGRYQEVHHGDDDHRNNQRENLFGACPLCHQVFHVGLSGMRDGGFIIYAPELTQAEINQISLLIWTIESTTDPAVVETDLFRRIRDRAVKLRGDLENRRGTVLFRMEAYLKESGLLPEGMKPKLSHYSPMLFANVLMSLDEATYARRRDLLGGLRLLPRAVRFEKCLEHWRDEQARTMPIAGWPSLVPPARLADIILSCWQRVADAEQRLVA